MPSLWPWLLVAGVSLGSGAGIAWRVASDRGQARLMQCEQERERDARSAAERAAALLRQSEHAQAQAAAELASAERRIQQRLQGARHDINRLATGRECLAGALRLRLNAAIDPAAAGELPESSGAAAAAAAEPADDTAVARWAIDAIERYDACRERIDAIRRWDEVTHGR